MDISSVGDSIVWGGTLPIDTFIVSSGTGV
jgi:hypothetical protein